MSLVSDDSQLHQYSLPHITGTVGDPPNSEAAGA